MNETGNKWKHAACEAEVVRVHVGNLSAGCSSFSDQSLPKTAPGRNWHECRLSVSTSWSCDLFMCKQRHPVDIYVYYRIESVCFESHDGLNRLSRTGLETPGLRATFIHHLPVAVVTGAMSTLTGFYSNCETTRQREWCKIISFVFLSLEHFNVNWWEVNAPSAGHVQSRQVNGTWL